MIRIAVAVAALLAGTNCTRAPANFSLGEVMRSGCRVQMNQWFQGNQCSDAPDRVAAVEDIARRMRRAADQMFIWLGPPKKRIRVCIVDRFPAVACDGRRLAGCTTTYEPYTVAVATRWQPDPNDQTLQPGYSWLMTLAHEMAAALTMAGSLNLPGLPDERAFVSSQQYRVLMRKIQEAI